MNLIWEVLEFGVCVYLRHCCVFVSFFIRSQHLRRCECECECDFVTMLFFVCCARGKCQNRMGSGNQIFVDLTRSKLGLHVSFSHGLATLEARLWDYQSVKKVKPKTFRPKLTQRKKLNDIQTKEKKKRED